MVTQFYNPKTVDEALGLIADAENLNVPIAGGSQLGINARGVDGLVNIARLGLSHIKKEAHELRIGATANIREIQRSEDVRTSADGIISKAAGNYLTALIRNQATIGGVIAGSSFWADIITVLVALNAKLKIRRRDGETSLALEQFIIAGARKSLGGGILSEIVIPLTGRGHICGCARIAKVETDISIVSAAIVLARDGKTVKSASVVVGNGDKPERIAAGEKTLIDSGMNGASIARAADAAGRINAPDDIRASGEYRKTVAPVLVRRLLEEF